jgi:hypothetical protein
MAVILNASTSSGFVQSADTSGVITLQNNGTSALSVTSGNLQFNSGYGSVATAYGCRAWVNFNGTGTPAIRASGNVTSITDNGVGSYRINFTTSMPDANYAFTGTAKTTNNDVINADNNVVTVLPFSYTTGEVSLRIANNAAVAADPIFVNIAIHR